MCSLGQSCGALRVAAGCTTPSHTPPVSRTLPKRVAVALRTAHLHCGPIARPKFRGAFDAPIIARGIFDPFGPPKSGPSPGFEALPLFVLLWQAEDKAAEEAAQVRSDTGCVASPPQCERRVVMRNTSLGRFAIAVPCTHAVQAEKAEAEKIRKAEAETANAHKVAVRPASGWHGTKGV